MPSAQKRRVLEKTRRRETRGRTYLVAIVLIVIAVGVGWYVYSSTTAGKPDFAIAAPTAVTIHAGTQTTSTVNITATNQFSGTILLTATGSPGLTATISPSSLTGSGTARLTTSAATNGSYTVTVIATSGSLTHSVTPKVATPVFATFATSAGTIVVRSEEHTSELQSQFHLVCRLLLEKKKKKMYQYCLQYKKNHGIKE